MFPIEFWREVVDRVAQEVPDTLLLAEAFWLMEGYFVRTLGMHRVYNSAFMNMLKREENEKYRMTIKNVLEFDPEILKRFVNFMNNPDERTAEILASEPDAPDANLRAAQQIDGAPAARATPDRGDRRAARGGRWLACPGGPSPRRSR